MPLLALLALLLPTNASAQLLYEPLQPALKPALTDRQLLIRRTGLYFTKYGDQGWPGAPEPTISCRAGDNGNLDCTGATATKVGSPTTVESPYYVSGFAAGPGKALRYNGTDTTHTLGDVDFTKGMLICGRSRQRIGGAVQYLIGKHAPSNLGFMLFHADTSDLRLMVYSATGNSSLNLPGVPAGSLSAYCVAYIFQTDGTSILRGNVNGLVPPEVTTATGPIRDVGGVLAIGRRNDTLSAYFDGDLSVLDIWDFNRTDWRPTQAQINAMVDAQQAMTGLTVTGPATSHQPTATSGVFTIPANRIAVGEKGALVYGGYTQQALNTEDASLWTGAGSAGATVAPNVWTWAGGSTGDRLGKSNTGGTSGKRFGSVTSPALGEWTGSCYLGADSLDFGNLQFATDGTVSVSSCVLTGIAAGQGARYSCTTTLSGTPTYLYANIMLGNSAATGTLHVAACNLTKTPVAAPYAATGASPLTVAATVPQATLPYTSTTGCLGATVQVDNPTAATTRSIVGVGPPGASNALLLYLVNGMPVCSVYDAAGAVRYRTASVLDSAPHDLCCCASPLGPVLVKDGSPSAVALAGAGTGMLTAAPQKLLAIGHDGAGGSPLNGSIKNARACFGSARPEDCP